VNGQSMRHNIRREKSKGNKHEAGYLQNQHGMEIQISKASNGTAGDIFTNHNRGSKQNSCSYLLFFLLTCCPRILSPYSP